MEEDTITNLKDLSKKDLKALQKKPKEPVAGPSTLTSEWPYQTSQNSHSRTSYRDRKHEQRQPPGQKQQKKKEKLRTVIKGQSLEVCFLLQR